MTESRQATVAETTNQGPTTGVAVDERTHYAHVRYAAVDQPGVIWYDPRDGHERLSLGVDTSHAALDLDERVLTGVRLHGHRNRCGIVDPSERWVLEIGHAEKVEVELPDDTDEMGTIVRSLRETTVHESQAAAREAAADRVPEYADAEWRDAVDERIGDNDD